MYRDSQLGLCLDLSGPDGNVFALWGHGDNLAKQLGTTEEWKGACEAARLMGASYPVYVRLFEQFFPIVTLLNKEVIFNEASNEETVEEDQEYLCS